MNFQQNLGIRQNMRYNPNDKGAGCTLGSGWLQGSFVASDRSIVRAFKPVVVPSYWEVTVNESNQRGAIGVCLVSVATTNFEPGTTSGGYYYWTFGDLYKSTAAQGAVVASNAGEIVGIFYNPSAGELKFYIDNVQIGSTMTGVPSGLYPFMGATSAGLTTDLTANFGHSAFAMAVPSGANRGVYV